MNMEIKHQLTDGLSFPLFDAKLITEQDIKDDIRYYCNPLLAKSFICVIGGEPKTGKTFLGLQWAFSLASGTYFLGFSIPEPIRVLYIDLEDSNAFFKKRVIDMRENFPMLKESLFKFTSVKFIDFDRDLSKIESSIIESKAQVVFIDSFSRLNFGSENDADAVTRTLTKFAEIQDKTGVAIVFIHHLSKPSANPQYKPENIFMRLRGSSVFYAWGSTYIILEKTGKSAQLYLESKHSKLKPNIPLVFTDDLIFERKDDPEIPIILNLLGEGKIQQSSLAQLLSVRIGKSPRHCERLLNKLADRGCILRIKEGNNIFYARNPSYVFLDSDKGQMS